MKRRTFPTAFLVLAFFFLFPLLAFSEELQSIQLPKPQLDGGKPLMQVLKERKSSREFSSEKLPVQVLSNLLWAAFGSISWIQGTALHLLR